VQAVLLAKLTKPSSQGEQIEVLNALLNVPGEQAEQADAREPLKVPGKQTAHATEGLEEKLPALQI